MTTSTAINRRTFLGTAGVAAVALPTVIRTQPTTPHATGIVETKAEFLPALSFSDLK